MTGLFEKSAHATQQRASGSIELAMYALNDTLMNERAARLALIVSEYISTTTNYLTLTAQMPGMSDGEVSGQKATLDSLVRRYPEFTALTVMDKNGRETAMSSSSRALTARDLASHPDAAYFKRAVKGTVYVALEPDRSTNDAPLLRVAVPIELYHGKTVGVLAARISLDDLWDTIKGARIGHSGFAYIVDQTGHALTPTRRVSGSILTASASIEPLHNTAETLPWRIVVAVPNAEAMKPVLALSTDISNNLHRSIGEMHKQIRTSSELSAKRLQADAASIQATTADRMQARAAAVFQRLTNTTGKQTSLELSRMQRDIQAQNAQSESENDLEMRRTAAATSAALSNRVETLSRKAAKDAKYHMALLAALITLVSCGIGSLIALFTAGRIVRPVVRLADAALAIAAGDLQRRVDDHAPDEIGELASAFNTMAEGQLVQSAKLASLGTLAAGVAHELNQPVAIIRGISQQLKADRSLSDDLREDLQTIEGQTSRMSKIIKHLRTFCRSGGAEMSEVDVHRTIHDCFLLVGEQLRTHNVDVEFDLCGGAPTVMGDANELEQVFLNLITNARDALDGRSGARLTICSRVRSGSLTVEFRDNGPGVPAAVQPHIFDPFFTTKEPGKGTGLGLSISHTIIGKHQGELRAHNHNGAVFTIVLPLVEHVRQQVLSAA